MLSRLEPQSVLALTATAGPPVAKDICRTLHIPLNETEHGRSEEPSPISIASEEHGVKVLSCNRDNIDVAVSYVSDEDERLSMVSSACAVQHILLYHVIFFTSTFFIY